ACSRPSFLISFSLIAIPSLPQILANLPSGVARAPGPLEAGHPSDMQDNSSFHWRNIGFVESQSRIADTVSDSGHERPSLRETPLLFPGIYPYIMRAIDESSLSTFRVLPRTSDEFLLQSGFGSWQSEIISLQTKFHLNTHCRFR